MVLRPRTRPLLRRAVAAAALGALIVPAVADAKAKKPKAPVITKVTPKTALVGAKLTIKGKHFKRGKGKNSVLFRRDKGKALFVKADVSTTKKLTVVIPPTLEKYMAKKGDSAVATRFRLRVLASKLSKRYTSRKASPTIGPARPTGTAPGGGNSAGAGVPAVPDGDCDADGVLNRADGDDDNDLLDDALELRLGLDPCAGDTDGDGVEDGFEYQSAIDLNDDDYQSPNYVVPYPAKTPYPNPLFKDADTDFDGDSLSQMTEYKLWKYTYEVNHTATRTLSPLSYSDGAQYSLSNPLQPASSYLPPRTFRDWTVASGYRYPQVIDPVAQTPYPAKLLFDMNHDGTESADEIDYNDFDGDTFISDDERDEDADGLTNFDEDTGRMDPGWWGACYADEGAFPIVYPATLPFDADTDGDGILDGADDQDFDDVPNIQELSRVAAGGSLQGACKPATGQTGDANPWAHLGVYVNPYNPCLPNPASRTCPRHPAMGLGYAPFKADWAPFVLN
jgi:hypothetical protein